MQDIVQRRAESAPEAVALVHRGDKMTYGNLILQAGQLARLLQESGCRPGDRVAFLIPKSPEAIVAMVGILMAGCAYVPMDPMSPPSRLSRILESSEPRVLLATGATADQVVWVLRAIEAGKNPRIGWIGAQNPGDVPFDLAFSSSDTAGLPPEPIHPAIRPSEPAHILFTSGSTGIPKGVVVTHANVRHFIDWAIDHFGIMPSDRCSGHSPLSFDLSTFDVFGTLGAGASLHLVPPELNLLPANLAGFIRSSALTQWFSVPSILSHMAKHDAVVEDDLPALKRLMWCGEVLPTAVLRRLMQRLPHVRFTNLYGPTETTIASSYHTLGALPPSDTAAVPVGRPCPGEALLVLDEHRHPVPEGVIGDLYVAGAGLSPGYWRDLERTIAAFVTLPTDPPTRAYRTGDLASVASDGLIYFHGRRDTQIKSRGYRIELGEIETALDAIDDLRESAVVAVATEGFEGTMICCAFVPTDGREVSPMSIRAALRSSLPSYMLPSRWLRLECLPTNPNGKIDRPAIAERFVSTR